MATKQMTPEQAIGPLNEVERKNAPASLFLQGDESLLRRGRRVSIVGSRKASKEGLARATRLARLCIERNVVVVSGLADGIDTAAHQASMRGGGRTIAVLGTPLDKAYPASNRELQARIGEDHLLVTQFPVGMAAGRKAFPMRNRTMALLSDATVIIEAGEGSGTLHQGWEALRLGRPLFITEAVMEAGLEWPAEMASYGAEVLSESTVEFFFDSLPEGAPERGELAL